MGKGPLKKNVQMDGVPAQVMEHCTASNCDICHKHSIDIFLRGSRKKEFLLISDCRWHIARIMRMQGGEGEKRGQIVLICLDRRENKENPFDGGQ